MVARNEKRMMKLLRLPILRPILLKREIFYGSLKNRKKLKGFYRWVAAIQIR